jgi:hypothetical protein
MSEDEPKPEVKQTTLSKKSKQIILCSEAKTDKPKAEAKAGEPKLTKADEPKAETKASKP